MNDIGSNISGLNGKTVVNFDLAHGSPSIIIAVSTLQEKVNTAHSAVKILDEYIAVHANSVYGWRGKLLCYCTEYNTLIIQLLSWYGMHMSKMVSPTLFQLAYIVVSGRC